MKIINGYEVIATQEEVNYALANLPKAFTKIELEIKIQEFRTMKTAEEQAAVAYAQRREAMFTGLNYNGYMISFTKDDGDALLQVAKAFEFGVTSTVVWFANGTKMPITAAELPTFGLWFVTNRNSFFEGSV